MGSQTHYFLALALPDEIKQSLYKICEQVQEEFPFRNWVHQQDYHITLAFLGQASVSMLEAAVTQVGNNLKGIYACNLMVNCLDIFGRQQAPRILWAGMAYSPSLMHLQQKVFTACLEIGFDLEKRAFTPHITLARKWESEVPFKLEKLKNHYQSLVLPSSVFTASEVVLLQTHLDRVPKYEIKQSFRLLS